jgi:hypothetical protein
MADERAFLQAISRLTSRDIAWLWRYRFGPGFLSLLEGDPGLGKSLIALDLCARLSRGLAWPDGSPALEPARCVILDREDDADIIIRPRLQALGADLDNIFVPAGWDRDIHLPDDLGPLAEELARLKPRLLVLDPVASFLGPGVNPTSDLSVRRALAPLQELAERYAIAVLLLWHLNKTAGLNPLYRGLQSIAFVAVCRTAWLAAADFESPERCILAQVKNNLAPAQPSLTYQVMPHDDGQPRLAWLGTSTLTCRQLLAGARKASLLDLGPRERAAEFLKAFLHGGPRTCHDIWAAAEMEGLTERTLRRAKDDLGISAEVVWTNRVRQTYWRLSTQEPPAPAQSDSDTAEFDAQLAALEAQYPSVCPLDEDV